MKIVFFGTPDFAANVLSDLLNHNLEVVAVVTKPDRAQGRSSRLLPTPVKCIAVAQSPPIPVFQPNVVSDIQFAPILAAFEADLFVVVAYGEIIKQHLLDMPKIACINLHASLLPAYRGAAPIQRCIINGEKETGITIIHMAKKMDAGDMIAKTTVAIGPDTTYGELKAELCRVGSQLLLTTIKNFEKGNTDKIIQDHSLATFASKIELEECKINWNQSVDQVHDLIRGVNPHPGAWCHILIKGEKKRLRIIASQIVSRDSKNLAGEIILSVKNELHISCGVNAEKGILNLIQMQLEGKKAMSAMEFLCGFPSESLQFLPD